MDFTEDEATDLAYRKTACLFSGCARLGAVLGKQPALVEEALADYGRYAGLAFQFVDDLLDFTGSSKQLGKPVLNDLKEGKVTLPLIFALGAGGNGNGASNSERRRLVATVLRERDFQSIRADQITDLVRETGALNRAAELARDYGNRAKACLEALPDTEYRRALLAVPDFILERES